MKKLRVLLTLSFLFLFLVGFTNGDPPQPEAVEDSSITVQVEFESPRILIDDYRSFQAYAEHMRAQGEKDSAMIKAFENIGQSFDQYLNSLERRYESSMDYLSYKTGKSIDEIYTAYDRKRKSDIVLVYLSIALFLIAFVTAFNRSIKNQRLGWRRQIAVFIVWTALFSGLIALLYQLLLFTLNKDYYYIEQMLNLSG